MKLCPGCIHVVSVTGPHCSSLLFWCAISCYNNSMGYLTGIGFTPSHIWFRNTKCYVQYTLTGTCMTVTILIWKTEILRGVTKVSFNLKTILPFPVYTNKG